MSNYDYLGIFLAKKTKCGLWIKMWGIQFKRRGKWQFGWQVVSFYHEPGLRSRLSRTWRHAFVVQ